MLILPDTALMPAGSPFSAAADAGHNESATVVTYYSVSSKHFVYNATHDEFRFYSNNSLLFIRLTQKLFVHLAYYCVTCSMRNLKPGAQRNHRVSIFSCPSERADYVLMKNH